MKRPAVAAVRHAVGRAWRWTPLLALLMLLAGSLAVMGPAHVPGSPGSPLEPERPPAAAADYGRLRLSFEPNVGQAEPGDGLPGQGTGLSGIGRERRCPTGPRTPGSGLRRCPPLPRRCRHGGHHDGDRAARRPRQPLRGRQLPVAGRHPDLRSGQGDRGLSRRRSRLVRHAGRCARVRPGRRPRRRSGTHSGRLRRGRRSPPRRRWRTRSSPRRPVRWSSTHRSRIRTTGSAAIRGGELRARGEPGAVRPGRLRPRPARW